MTYKCIHSPVCFPKHYNFILSMMNLLKGLKVIQHIYHYIHYACNIKNLCTIKWEYSTSHYYAGLKYQNKNIIELHLHLSKNQVT